MLSPIQPHAPYFRRSARVLYPEGPEPVQGGCGPHFWPLRVDRMPRHAPPSAVALKGPEPFIGQGVQGSAYPPPQMKAVQGFRRGRVRKPTPTPRGPGVSIPPPLMWEVRSFRGAVQHKPPNPGHKQGVLSGVGFANPSHIIDRSDRKDHW